MYVTTTKRIKPQDTYGKEDIKASYVEKESYYITVLRYIEANTKRAKLVRLAEDWGYGSLHRKRT